MWWPDEAEDSRPLRDRFSGAGIEEEEAEFPEEFPDLGTGFPDVEGNREAEAEFLREFSSLLEETAGAAVPSGGVGDRTSGSSSIKTGETETAPDPRTLAANPEEPEEAVS